MRRWIAAAYLIVLIAVPAAAQVKVPAAPESRLEAVRTAELFRLGFASSYGTDPVLCDSLPTHSEAVRGTMTVRRVPSAAPSTMVFEIEDINWLLTLPSGDAFDEGEVLVTGSGRYTLMESEPPAQGRFKRLELTLRIGDEEGVEFDSGFVLNPVEEPGINISVREVTDSPPCEAREFRVAAQAVPNEAIGSYTLDEGSGLLVQQSPSGPVRFHSLNGRFQLVQLPIEPGVPALAGQNEWALVRALWRGDDTPGPGDERGVRGAAIYQHVRAKSVPEPVERMRGAFAVRTPTAAAPDGLLRFDSGVAGSPWIGMPGTRPTFDIVLMDTDLPAFPAFGLSVVSDSQPGS